MNETFMKARPVLPLLLSMGLPMMVSMLVSSLYNIVDSFFIAQISEEAMMAISLVFPVQNFVNAVAIGFGVGVNAVISNRLGAGDQAGADEAATRGVVLSVLHGVLAMAVCIPLMPVFLSLFTKNAAVTAYGREYAAIVFAFSIGNMLNLVYEKIFQAVGRMKTSMAALISGCIFNIVMDPVLINGLFFFPELGIRGAAIATGLGQLVSLLVYLVMYVVRPLSVKIRHRYIKPDMALDKRLYGIGIPAMLNMALASFLVSALNAILSAYSEIYIVILGIYYKLQTFLYLPVNGLVQGMRPLIGYNYGAGEKRRVRKIFLTALAIAAAIMLAGTVISQLFAGELIGLYTENPGTIAAGARALRIISLGFVVSSVSVIACGALEGLGKGLPSLVISLFRYVILILPLALVFCRLLGPETVWNAFWSSELLTAVIAAFIFAGTLSDAS